MLVLPMIALMACSGADETLPTTTPATLPTTTPITTPVTTPGPPECDDNERRLSDEGWRECEDGRWGDPQPSSLTPPKPTAVVSGESGDVDLQIDRCGSDDVTGTVTNNTGRRVDVFIEVIFLRGEIQVGDTLASASGLDPGRIAEWDAPVFDTDYTRCEARISNIFND